MQVEAMLQRVSNRIFRVIESARYSTNDGSGVEKRAHDVVGTGCTSSSKNEIIGAFSHRKLPLSQHHTTLFLGSL